MHDVFSLQWVPEELRVFILIVKACAKSGFRTLRQDVHVNNLHIFSFLFKGKFACLSVTNKAGNVRKTYL